MLSGKKIEVNSATLISLKAELIRKAEEVKEAKTRGTFIKQNKLTTEKKSNIWDKQNTGISSREARDLAEVAAEKAAIERAKGILEAKAELYERLTSNTASKRETIAASSVALVDFSQKRKAKEHRRSVEESSDDEPAHDSDHYEKADHSDDEWVEYTDCLGRTRRCLKRDLSSIKDRDKQLSDALGYDKKDDKEENKDEEEKEDEKEEGEIIEEKDKLKLFTEDDIQRETLKAKWQLEENELLNKDNIHYQDILFDEVRTHGVSYYQFSRDEKKRKEEQKELAKAREETRLKQVSIQEARAKRDRQLRARLLAATNRKREREGLPPLPESVLDEKISRDDSDEEADLEKALFGPKIGELPKEPEPLTREEQPKPSIPREWDFNKETQVMSQDEWNEMQRTKRFSEFAPPSTSTYGFHAGGKFQLSSSRKRSPSPDRNKDKKNKHLEPLKLPNRNRSRSPPRQRRYSSSSSSSDVELIGPPPPPLDNYVTDKKKNKRKKKHNKKQKIDTSVPPPNYMPDISIPPPNYPLYDIPLPTEKEEISTRGKGTEIPPPTLMDYHLSSTSKFNKPTTSKSMKKDNDVLSSISAGLEYLKKQVQDKPKKDRFDSKWDTTI